MIPLPMRSLLQSCLAFLLLASALVADSVTMIVPSRHVLVGEVFTVAVSFSGNSSVSQAPDLKLPDGLTSRHVNTSSRLINRDRYRDFIYRVTANREGTFVIPSLKFRTPSGSISTRAVTLTCHPLDTPQVQWLRSEIGSQQFEYGVATFVATADPYELQVFPTELKLYLPQALQFDHGIAEMQTQGLNVQRYEPVQNEGMLTRDNARYSARVWSAIASARDASPAALGPANEGYSAPIRYIPRGQFRGFNGVLPLPFPKVEISPRALPQPAPATFDRSVGEFELDVTADFSTAAPGDAIPVTITVSGAGNLDTLNVPQLQATEGWTIYPPNKELSEGVRTRGEGSVAFTQLLRPTREQKEIPSLILTYFDVVSESYETLTSEPIPLPEALQTLGSRAITDSALDLAGGKPELAMTSPLGPITISHSGPTWPPSPFRFQWWWNLVPGVLFAGLWIYRRVKRSRSLARPKALLKSQEARLESLADSSRDTVTFYREVGSFIENSAVLGSDTHSVDLLARRDEVCFDPEREAGKTISGSERREVVAKLRESLRKATLGLIVFLAIGADRSVAVAAPDAMILQAAEAAYAEGDPAKAVTELKAAYPEGDFTADALYNLGVYSAAAGQPGEALLNFRRALALNPAHVEARQNTVFLREKLGSLVFSESEGWQRFLTFVPRSWLLLALCASFWLIVGAWMLCGRGKRLGLVAVGSIVFPLAVLSLAFYPKHGDRTEIQSLGIVTSETTLRTGALSSSGSVIDLPAGSELITIEERGNWHYVEVPGRLRGWLPTKNFRKIER